MLRYGKHFNDLCDLSLSLLKKESLRDNYDNSNAMNVFAKTAASFFERLTEAETKEKKSDLPPQEASKTRRKIFA